MADYFDLEASGIRITARPVGWRNICPLFRKVPFVTGSDPRFNLRIDTTKAHEGLEDLAFRYRFRPGIGDDEWLDLPKKGKIRIRTRALQWGESTGQLHLEGDIAFPPFSRKDRPVTWTFVRMDMLSSDTVALVLLSVLTAIIVGLMSIGGAWLLDVLRDGEPIPVYIVEPIPPTASPPASQSETDSNAP